ncbi:MAG: energy transducer TonB [Betaproteobacteria bacterium]|nr:energy transducer TonB [Betaproteobacteria bacterium]
MSYAISRFFTAQRSGLLSIVVGLHIAVLLSVLAAKTAVPQVVEMPLLAELLRPPEAEKKPEAKPLLAVGPQAIKPRILVPQTPLIEASASPAHSAAAPLASPRDAAPSGAAPEPAEPVSPARFDAAYLKNPAPAYPPLSRRMGEEGKVILRVLVTEQGTAGSVEIKASSGSPRLDEAAANTVRHWKFIPAMRGGSDVQSWVWVPVVFRLEH